MRGSKVIAALALLPIMAVPIVAHTGVENLPPSSFAHGIAHPISGLDHVVAMLAVGIWAARAGGRMIWALPLTFVVSMALAGLVGMQGFPFPLLESGIMASIFVLGFAIAMSRSLPAAGAILLTALFACFHGYAHGMELEGGMASLPYTAGFTLMTAVIHVAGIGIGLMIGKVAQARKKEDLAYVTCGGAIALCGLVMLLMVS
jgi:urease accessory protein